MATVAAAGSLGAAAAAGGESDSGELAVFSMLGVASGVATASTSTALAPSHASGRSSDTVGGGGGLRAASSNTNSTPRCSPTEPNSEVSGAAEAERIAVRIVTPNCAERFRQILRVPGVSDENGCPNLGSNRRFAAKFGQPARVPSICEEPSQTRRTPSGTLALAAQDR